MTDTVLNQYLYLYKIIYSLIILVEKMNYCVFMLVGALI